MRLFNAENTFLSPDTKFGIGRKNSYLFRDEKYVQFDFVNNEDCTRLIVDSEPLEICGHNLFRSYVTWYNKKDKVHILDCNKFDDDRNYYQILVEIDNKRIFVDRKYYNYLMNVLLNKERIFRYISNSFDENARIKSGMYVGGILVDNNNYSKIFYEDIGSICHNLDDMIVLRHKYMYGNDLEGNDIHLDVRHMADQLIEFIQNKENIKKI